MKKRIISALMCLSLMAFTFAGCGSESTEIADDEVATASSENFNETGYPIVNEEITLKVMIGIRDQDTLIDPSEMPTIQAIEELTGINIEWEVVKGSDWETKLNLMFASGDMPDIIISSQSTVDYEEYGVTQGLLVSLDDYYEQYMPNYTERLANEETDPTISLVASDGNKYCVPFLFAQDINDNCPFFINQTWLDTLGLDMPTNTDELLDTLRAFATEDPNGNGEADEVAFEMCLEHGWNGICNVLPLFGIPADTDSWVYLDDNGDVQFAPTQDGFRECMEWLHTAYAEGLLDAEVVSQDSNTMMSKLAAGNVGFCYAWRLGGMGYEDGVEADCTLFTMDGIKMNTTLELCNAQKGVFFTSSNEHLAESLRLIDTFLDTEYMWSLYYGEKDNEDGAGWSYNDDGLIEIYASDSDEAKDFLDCNAPFFAPATYASSVYVRPETRDEKTAYCRTYDELGLHQVYSNTYFDLAALTSDQQQELTLIETDIDNAVDENVANFIINGVTDDSWNSFVTIFENMGIDSYVETYQTAIDDLDL